MKKFLTLFAILVLLSLLLTHGVFADQWSPTEDWYPRHEKTNSWDGYVPSMFWELEKNNLLKP